MRLDRAVLKDMTSVRYRLGFITVEDQGTRYTAFTTHHKRTSEELLAN